MEACWCIMNHRRIILRVISENYSRINPALPREIIRFRLEFPREIMPPYRFYMSDGMPRSPSLLTIPLSSQIKYSKILIHTRYIGDYTENEESGVVRRKITYFREPDDGMCPTKVEPGLPLA
jgi:hypothetical protein